MRITSSQCRQFAEQCVAMAETAQLENVTALHNMAETWLQLAEQLLAGERSAKTVQNAPSTKKVR